MLGNGFDRALTNLEVIVKSFDATNIHTVLKSNEDVHLFIMMKMMMKMMKMMMKDQL